jgi:hypothetical protein
MSTRPLALRAVPLLLAIAIVAVGRSTTVSAAGPVAGDMVEGKIQGRRVEGLLLGVGIQQVQLLGRDGWLWLLAPNQATGLAKTASTFRPYSPTVLRDELLREVSRDYEISGTSHYLVIYPRGQRDKWAERFEELYRSFVLYFSVRGFQPAAPAFPLIGFVCKNRGEFDRIAKQKGMSSGVLGYYSNISNRITLYDMSGANGTNWTQNASVLIHEATHQTAFNTGIHNRYSPPPNWVAEGLATMFEAPGVYDSHNHTQRTDRVNRGRLQGFRLTVLPRHKPETISSIVASDSLFRADPMAAYAEAWALTFYLVETQPRKYAEYLKRTASHPTFHQCTAAERTADFTTVFGGNWRMIEAQFLRFMADVK